MYNQNIDGKDHTRQQSTEDVESKGTVKYEMSNMK